MKVRQTDKWFLGKAFFVVFMLVVCGTMVSLTGCGASDSSDMDALTAEDQTQRFQEEYFQYAMENLQSIQKFGGGEMRQQIVDRLNQWIATQQLPSDWKLDPMVEKLPVEVDLKQFDEKHFTVEDGYALQQAIWMRDLSKWTCGDSNDPVERGEKLFDWIVRNVMLQRTPDGGFRKIPKKPWETLFFGRGTATDRAWVFCLAARQQAIDAVVLVVPSKEDPEKLIPWAIGLMKGKELYLFDPKLGLPIPAKDGVVREKTQLVVTPATLSQVLEDPAILRQLDLSETERYPISIEQIQETIAMIPASSSMLSARFALIESRMTGNKRAVLTVHPSALAKDLSQVNGLREDQIRLWPRPFMVEEIRANLGPDKQKAYTLAMQPFMVGRGTPLWKGRAAHIMGKLVGEHGATWYYQKARPSNRKLIDYEELYESDKTKLSTKDQRMLQSFRQAKQDATYWLGLVDYSLDDPQAAEDYFAQRILGISVDRTQTSKPIYSMSKRLDISFDATWRPGAIYNWSRCLEQFGDFRNAAEILQRSKLLPAGYGNQLRAKWLVSQEKPAVEGPAEKEKDAPSEEAKGEGEKPAPAAERSES